MSEAFDGTNKKNRYTCERCGQSIVTIDRCQGVTPFMLMCRATEGCNGMMVSAMYRGAEALAPNFEWRKPTPEEYEAMSPAMREHIDSGGLQIYPIATLPNDDLQALQTRYLKACTKFGFPDDAMVDCQLPHIKLADLRTRLYPELEQIMQVNMKLFPPDCLTD